MKYSYGDKQTENELENFEREYIREKNVAYIRVKEDFVSFDNLIRIQEFDDAVAEIISAIIDVNEEKDVYQLLFKENDVYREKWMRSSRGDEDLELLSKARIAFDIDLNARDTFWRNILEIVGGNVTEILSSDVIIKELQLDDIHENCINYEKLEEYAPFIINLFKKLQIDIIDYNRISSIDIDVSEYWYKLLNEKLEKYKSKYLIFIFERLKNDVDCVERYEEYKRTYGIIDKKDLNSVNIDISQFYQNLYGVSFECLEKIENVNLIEEELENNKKNNVEKFAMLSDSVPVELLSTYLLFNRRDLLEKQQQKDSENEKMNQEAREKQNRETNAILAEIRSSIGANFDSVQTEAIASKITMPHDGKKTKRKGAHSNLSDQTKQNDGLIGEAKVYYGLKEKYHESVDWVSGNAEIAKVVVKGNDSLGYDIKYKDSIGTIHYVEVKASRNDDVVFTLTKNELAFAKANANNYEIIFVFLDEFGKPKGNPKLLGNLFCFRDGEDLLKNSRFSIENKDFTIFAKIVKEE